MVRSQTVGLDEFIARWIGRAVPPTAPCTRAAAAVVPTLALAVELPVPGTGVRRHPGWGTGAGALHDVIAGTAVIYSWDARAARLRFLSRG